MERELVGRARFGRSGAAYGDKSTMSKCRLGYVVGLTSSALRGPCHIIQWASKFTSKVVKSRLGGETYAYSEMVDHVSMLRGFYAHFLNLPPGMVGLVDCKCLFTHLKSKEITTGAFLVRHFLASQQTLETQELGNVYWLPGSENPADGLTKTESDAAELLRLSEPGTYDPGA